MRTGASGIALVLMTGGCSGKEREIPMWVDGILLEGDCQESYEAYDSTPVLQSILIPNPNVPDDPAASDPNFRMEDLPDPVGAVVTDQATYEQIVFQSMNFAQVPAIDFATQQAVFVWARNTDTCGLSIDEWQVNTKSDGSYVLDVQIHDASLNCDTSCGLDYKALVMVEITNAQPASFCRRTRPGCEPDATVR